MFSSRKSKKSNIHEEIELVEMTFFPRIPDEDSHALMLLRKTAYRLALLYKAMDAKVLTFTSLAQDMESMFIEQYRNTHAGLVPDKLDVIPEVSRLAVEHETYLREEHGFMQGALFSELVSNDKASSSIPVKLG